MAGLDERDLQLINVLQWAPRAPWVDVGPIVHLSPSAAADRWRRLSDEGVAWVTAHAASRVGRPVTGLVELAVTQPVDAHVARLCALPEVSGLDEVLRVGRLMATIQVPDVPALAAFVDAQLTGGAGVQVTGEWFVTDIIRQGAEWRLDTLDGPQRSAAAALAANAAVPHRRPATPPGQLDPIIACLAEDARLPVAEMARRLGRDPSTVRRQVQEVLASGFVRFRCDASPGRLGWPVTSAWFGRVPPAEFDATLAVLRAMSELRLGLGLAGEDTLFFSAFHRSAEGVAELRRKLGQRLPGLAVTRSLIMLRSHKRSGWLIGPDGRRTGTYVRPAILHGEFLDA